MNTLLIKKISCIFIFLIPYLLFAQEEKRLALVIGNSEYTSGRLNNAVNDANKVSAKLKTLGFDVILKNNASNQAMGEAINDFTDKATNYNVALFYYAGHGIQSHGSNYLIPVNDNMIKKESDIEYYSQNVNRVLRRLEDSGCKLKIIILDACRNNPFERSWHRSVSSAGLVAINAPDGTLIAYATSPGSVAEDGVNAQNSPYTTVFLQTLDKPNLSIFEFFNEVGSIVRLNTENKQTPWFSTSPIEGNFKFNQSTTVESESSVTFNLSPSNAIIKFGNATYKNGQSVPCTMGNTYSFIVEADGYQALSDEITVDESTSLMLSLSLKKEDKEYDDSNVGESIETNGGSTLNEKTSQLSQEGIYKDHTWVDLGLSVMWATCNVGASLPEECGEYYAWGDIESKEIFKESNASTFGLKIGDISCNPAYDAARHNWGGLWRMPTASEVDELLRKCKWEKVRSKGSWCFCATGPNGNTIIFPLSGFKIGNSFIQKNEGAKYWSSTPNVSDSNVAYCWGFLDREYAMWNSKLVGNVIRPVIDKKDVNDMLVDNVQDSALPNLVVTVNGVKFSMTRVAGGTFTMGATKEQIGAREDECPSHRVTLSDYYIGTTEVTQELYMAVMGSNPSFFTGNSHYPVEQVSKSDCEEFIKRLNELTGENFSLPTEAQWEYAARGGNLSLYNLYSGSDSIDDVAWYSNNSLGCTHEVGSKRPNQLGIYDMSGNVFEWCEDNYNMYTSEEVSNPISHGGIFEVLRGGGWNSSKTNCRISYRNTAYKSVKHSYYGFRLALNQVKFLNIESK